MHAALSPPFCKRTVLSHLGYVVCQMLSCIVNSTNIMKLSIIFVLFVLFFRPKLFFRQILEIIDAVVVLVSFIVVIIDLALENTSNSDDTSILP